MNAKKLVLTGLISIGWTAVCYLSGVGVGTAIVKYVFEE